VISCCPQQIGFSLLNCVFHNDLSVRCQIVLFAANQVFANEFVLSIANQVFAAELCCSQRIRCLLSNCVFRSESSVHYQTYVACSELGFTAELICSVGKEVLLPKLCCLQRICVCC